MPKQRSLEDPNYLEHRNSGALMWILLETTDFPLRDGDPPWTIGFYQESNEGEGSWVYVGWCWSHDHFTNHSTDPESKEVEEFDGKLLTNANIVGWAVLEFPS